MIHGEMRVDGGSGGEDSEMKREYGNGFWGE
jgi:hypothetical protein